MLGAKAVLFAALGTVVDFFAATAGALTKSLASGAVVTLRGSGTEPKIKWYAEMVAPVKKDAEAKLAALVDAVVEEMLQPEKNGLERRK